MLNAAELTNWTLSEVARSAVESAKLAAARYLADRDTRVLEQAMVRLDTEEAEAKTSSRVVEPAEAVAWLRGLPALWAAADASGRRLLTEAILERVEVLGVQSVTIHPTPEADAHGWSEAFGPGPLLLNPGLASSAYGRGERISPETKYQPLLIPVTNIPSYIQRGTRTA